MKSISQLPARPTLPPSIDVTRLFPVSFLTWICCFASTLLPSEATAAAEDKVVDVVASGHPSTVAGVEVVVRELVARLPVVLRWSQASGIDPTQVLAERAPDVRIVARAWMDLSDAKRARIYVANAGGGRFLVRVVPLREGYDEVAREVLGHIIESAVDAFLAGRDVGVSREIAEREVSQSSAPPQAAETLAVARAIAPESTRIGLAVSYQATGMEGVKATMHGPAIGAAFAVPIGGGLRLGSSASVQYRVPFHWDSASVGARFESAAARLGLGIEGDLKERVVLRAELGFGFDFVHVAPYVEAGSTARATPAEWFLAPIASAMLSLEAPLVSQVGLRVAAGSDVDLSGPSYFVASGGTVTTVLSPWVVRPVIALGAVFRWEKKPDRSASVIHFPRSGYWKEPISRRTSP
jgi:hypothetical protein